MSFIVNTNVTALQGKKLKNFRALVDMNDIALKLRILGNTHSANYKFFFQWYCSSTFSGNITTSLSMLLAVHQTLLNIRIILF